jgi:sugar phosphate isomerase/epimerase
MRWGGQWTDLASRDPRIASASLQCLNHCMTLAQEIDCHRLVFHAYSPHIQFDDLRQVQRDRDTVLQRLTRVLQRLGEASARAEVVLCWENTNAWVELRDQRWFNTLNVFPRDIGTVFATLDLPFLRLAFDTAHAWNACTEYRRDARLPHLFSQEERPLTVATFLERVAPWVELLHVSDAMASRRGTGREGLPLGTGEIDFSPFFTVLRRQLPRAPLILEIHEADVDHAVRMQQGRDHINTQYFDE